MYKAMDIAQYTINYSIQTDKPISNLKLQKLLYYIQAAFLIETGEPCFVDDIKNWRHGPVVPEVYSEYKRYLNNDITDKQISYSQLVLDENMNISVKYEEYNEENIEKQDKILIKKVVDSLSKFGAWDLVDRTHQEDPWNYSERGDTITNESIKNYFENPDNKRRIYGEI